MPPDSRDTARPLMPHGQAARPGLGLGVDVGGVVPHLDIHGELRVVHVHLQIVIGLVELAAHILAELDGGHGEGLVRPLGLHLEGFGGAQLGIQEFFGGGQNGVLVLFTGPSTSPGMGRRRGCRGVKTVQQSS